MIVAIPLLRSVFRKKPFIDVVMQHIPWIRAKKEGLEGQAENGKSSNRAVEG